MRAEAQQTESVPGDSRPGRTIVFIGAGMLLVLTALVPLLRSHGQTHWAIAFDTADAGFYQRRREEAGTNIFAPKFVSKVRVLGVLKVFSREEVRPPFQRVLGTNTLHVGDRLFDPTSKREMWQVISLERGHEFEDGSVHDGVLVRAGDGAEAWMMRERMGKALVGR